jgi:predicted NACHT family NTPase
MIFTEVQKLDFVRNIKTEIDLLDEILMPMFTNIKEIKAIRTHGIDEKGKDIVLISKNPLGKKSYTAVIVKNEPITNASVARDKEIVATVSTQIVMCIDSGYDSVEEGKKVFFNEILVLTSKSISNSAREQLVEIASKHRFTNILFWETKEIVDYIDKYLPEVYLVSSGVLSRYFHCIKEKCENLNELKKIAIYSGEDRHLSEVYVEPKLFSRVEKIVNGKTTASIEDSSLSSLIKKGGHFLIMGSAGSGKSTLLRSEIYRMILDYESNRSDVIPILIKIKDLVKHITNEDDYKCAVTNYLSSELALDTDQINYILDKNKQVCFFFDGYDELSTEVEKKKLFLVIDHMSECFGCTIIVSSRKIPFGITDNFHGYNRWELADFSVKQITAFFEKWFKSANEKLIADLKDHDLLDKLPNTPMVMTLIAILFESDSNVEIPSNLSELYRMFVDLLVGRWNLDRKIDTFYKANDKETFLTSIALYLHLNNKLSCTEEELMEIFTQTGSDLGRKFDFDLLKTEIIRDTNLLILNERNEYEFRHLSFQEYFVGVYLTVAGDIESVVAKVPHPWWSQVLYFYCGTRKINDDILPKIMRRINSLHEREKILAIYEMGYLIQSSYKTKASIRTTLLAESVLEYAHTLPQFVESIDEDVKNFPKIIRYLSLVEGFRVHFSSKYLEELYNDLFRKMKEQKYESFEQALSLFIIASIVASNGNIEALSDSDSVLKEYPLLLLMEDFMIRCVIMEEENDKIKLIQAKEQSRVITKRIKNNKQLYISLLKE